MKSPMRIFGELTSHAKLLGQIGNQKFMLQRRVERGEPLPDILKPGALLDQLSPKDRAALSDLRSEDVQKYGWMEYAYDPELIARIRAQCGTGQNRSTRSR